MSTSGAGPSPRPPEGSAVGGRARWQQLADDLVQATQPYASPTGSLVVLPGPSSVSGRWSDGLEGYARTFLLAAFRIRGAEGHAPAGLIERYARGVTAGVDPHSPERWPTIAERGQAVVEAASVAIGLSETRPWLWDHLGEGTQQRVVEWLAGVVGTGPYTNNWLWFQNVITGFLRTVDGPWSQADLDRNDEIADGLYVGDGWYSDGTSPAQVRQHFDYYAGWAWHVYPLLESRMLGTDLAPRHRQRLTAYLHQARHLVGSRGAPLVQGRSLTYRFALLAPFWAGAIAGSTPLERGQTRELADAVLDHFLDAGCMDERGLLPIGWHREYVPLRQRYSGGSSPYWASKGMLGLVLPEGHQEWDAVARPAPREAVEVRSFPAPGWLVVSTAADGIVRVVNHGSDRITGPAGEPRADDPVYGRLGYSTVTSPDLGADDVAAPAASHVALLDVAGQPSHRDAIQRVYQGDGAAVSRSRVHWLDLAGTERAAAGAWASLRRGPVLSVASVVHGVHEVRAAWWNPDEPEAHPSAALDADSAWPRDAGPWRLHLGGWPVPVPECDLGEPGADGEQPGTAPCRVDVGGLHSVVVPLQGDLRVARRRSVGGNAFAPASLTPVAASAQPVPAGRCLAVLVALAGTQVAIDLAAVASLDVEPGCLTVRWCDGRVDTVPAPGVAS